MPFPLLPIAIAAGAVALFAYASRHSEPEKGSGDTGVVGGQGPQFDSTKAVRLTVTEVGSTLTIPVGQSVMVQNGNDSWSQCPESDNAVVMYGFPNGCGAFVGRSPGVAHITGTTKGVLVSGTVTVV